MIFPDFVYFFYGKKLPRCHHLITLIGKIRQIFLFSSHMKRWEKPFWEATILDKGEGWPNWEEGAQVALTPGTIYKPPPQLTQMESLRKSLEGIRSNYSHIDNKSSAAISFAESMGIDAHGNFNGMHRKRKIPKRLMEIGTRPLL